MSTSQFCDGNDRLAMTLAAPKSDDNVLSSNAGSQQTCLFQHPGFYPIDRPNPPRSLQTFLLREGGWGEKRECVGRCCSKLIRQSGHSCQRSLSQALASWEVSASPGHHVRPSFPCLARRIAEKIARPLALRPSFVGLRSSA